MNRNCILEKKKNKTLAIYCFVVFWVCFFFTIINYGVCSPRPSIFITVTLPNFVRWQRCPYYKRIADYFIFQIKKSKEGPVLWPPFGASVLSLVFFTRKGTKSTHPREKEQCTEAALPGVEG